MNPPSTQPTERRRCPRASDELLFTCRSSGQRSETGYFTRNISAEGLMFESSDSIAPEARLEIELYAPLDCGKQTRVYMLVGAKVRWVSEIPGAFGYEGSNRYRVGVVFDEIGPQDQACLDQYVKKRLMMGSAQSVT